MKRSLFMRMLFVYILIIVVAFATVGGIFFSTMRNIFLDTQMDEMIKDAKIINSWVEDNFHGVITDFELRPRLSQKAKDEGTVIWLVTNTKEGFSIADPENKGNINEKSKPESVDEFLTGVLKKTQRGEPYKQVSKVDNTFEDYMMSVAIPMTVDDINIGAIVVHKEVGDYDPKISLIFRGILISLLISIGFASILVFILSRYIVHPIKAVSMAAAELSRGNLDWRVRPRTEDEIGELAVTFNKMAEDIKLQDALRNTFIANVSHELRTPLAAVQGFIQGMLDRAIEEKDRDKYLDIVLGETKRMNSLITDLLTLAKIESGQFPIELSEFDINELLRRCVIMFEQRIEEKKLRVNIELCDEKLMVWADEDRISQVVTNLIDNAVKFSFEGGELKVWTDCAENKVYVNISDTGEGIPKEEQQYVFERFYKVDKSHSRNKPGTGLGLSIVKRIIMQHGERITLQSEEGKGTAFKFSLTRSVPVRPEKNKTK